MLQNRDVDELAKGQRRAALIVRALENMTSEERLKKSGAFNLDRTVLVVEGGGCCGFSVHKSCC